MAPPTKTFDGEKYKKTRILELHSANKTLFEEGIDPLEVCNFYRCPNIYEVNISALARAAMALIEIEVRLLGVRPKRSITMASDFLIAITEKPCTPTCFDSELPIIGLWVHIDKNSNFIKIVAETASGERKFTYSGAVSIHYW